MKLLRPWNLFWVTLFLLSCLVLWMPSSATANKAADDPGTYGAWGNDPRQGASNGITIAPFNDKQPEMVSFACIVNGEPLPNKVVSVLSEIGLMSLTIFRGKIDEYSFGGRSDDNDEVTLWSKENYGFPTGMEGVRKFIKLEKKWLDKPIQEINSDGADDVNEGLYETKRDGKEIALSAWSKHSNRQFQGGDNPGDTATQNTTDDGVEEEKNDRMPWYKEGDESVWLFVDKGDYRKKDNIEEAREGFPLTTEQAELVASLIRDSPKSPSNIYSEKIPDGCIPASFDAGLETSFGDLFNDPTAFIASILISPVIDISNSIYQAIHTKAWSGLFTTAHTERGDLIWDLDDQCLQGGTAEGGNADTCQNNKPLGFSKKNTKDNVKDRPLFLDLANLIAWLITGTYFVILFSAAVLFIYRGNQSQKFNLMKVTPRILLSMMVAIAAPFLIGTVITVSNWATTGIFDMMDSQGSPITSMNLMLSQAGTMMGIENELAVSAIMAVVSIIALGATAVFLLGVLLKQLALIALIVLAPVAIFCLIVESWRPKFMRWLKALMILALLPVIMATILQLGVLLNPLMKGSVNDTISIFMLILTLAAMGWVMQKGVSIAIRGKNTNVLSGILQGAGMGVQGLSRIPGVGNFLGGALGVAGQGLRAGGQALDKQDLGDKLAGKLIPEGRAAGGAGAGGHALQRFARSMRHGADVGRGYRGISGGRGRRRNRGYGGGNGKDKKNKKPGFVRRQVQKRVSDPMARSIQRVKNNGQMRRRRRQEQRMEDGRRNYRRPLSLVGRMLGRPQGFEARTRGLGIPAELLAGGTASMTLTGAQAERVRADTLRIESKRKAEMVLNAKRALQDEADRVGGARGWGLRARATSLQSYGQLRKLLNEDSSFMTGNHSELATDMWAAMGDSQERMMTEIHQETGTIGGSRAQKRDKGGNLTVMMTEEDANYYRTQEDSPAATR